MFDLGRSDSVLLATNHFATRPGAIGILLVTYMCLSDVHALAV